MVETIDAPTEDESRVLTAVEEKSASEIKQNLSKLTIETTRKFNAANWIEMSETMVDLFDSFKDWDGKTLETFQTIFDEAYGKVERQGVDAETNRFIQRWNGWIGEAAIKRMFREAGFPYKTSKRLDANGVDGLTVFASVDETYFMFLQGKASGSLPTGIHMMDANEIKYHQKFEASNGETRRVRQAIKPKSNLARLQPNGDIHDFCLEEAAALRKAFLMKNADKGVDPDKHQSHVSVVLAAVGMEAQDMDSKYGWMELMKTVHIGTEPRIDKNGEKVPGQLTQEFTKQLLDIVDTAEKIA